MITRHELVILKRAQRKAFDFAQIAEKQGNAIAAKQFEDESAVILKVISYFEDLKKIKK